ncbi:hypothetical protein B0A52_02533 [Exophiala mesophila]|uniref:Alpha/beta hydrolase fold-3 domain-containing protein n=1 Tax=Exophiala mesophila TaxID=212818 RepID=A0A438NCY4_EXOME|nr:hypothetical protein B0A52_02533 [Exophiala mesophila]
MSSNLREEQTPRPTDEDATPKAESSSIQITTRDDLSLLYRFVRTIIKPLRPKLASSSTQQPGGSIRLIPPHKEDLEVIESQVESVWQYTYQTKSSAASPGGHGARPAHQIYYFHGGGFQMRPSNQHRVFLRRLSRDLYRRSQTQVPNRPEPLLTLVSYPLAPHSPAHKSLPILQKWLSATLDNAVQSGDTVTLMGDSSGGNLALSLGFWASEHYKAPSAVAHFDSELGSKEGVPSNIRPKASSPLVSIIAISPAVDLRNVNPEIQQMDRLDPVLTAKLTGDVGQIWSTGSSSKKPSDTKADHAHFLSVDDPQLSPLLNSENAFRGLASKDIKIHGIFGTFDVLSPDAKLFMHKCEKYGVRGQWLVWEGQMHCFPLTAGKGIRGIKEGREGLKWLEDVIMAD